MRGDLKSPYKKGMIRIVLLTKKEMLDIIQKEYDIEDQELIQLGIKKRKETALTVRLNQRQKEWLTEYCYKKRITEKAFFEEGILKILSEDLNIKELRSIHKKNKYNRLMLLDRSSIFYIENQLANQFKELCKHNNIKYSQVLRSYCVFVSSKNSKKGDK